MATLSSLSALYRETIQIGDSVICPADYPPIYLYAKPINSSSLPYFTGQRDTISGRTGYKPANGTTWVGMGIITMLGAGSAPGVVYLSTSTVDAGAQTGSAPTGYTEFMVGCDAPTATLTKTSHFYTLDGSQNRYLGGSCFGSGGVILSLVGFEIPTPIY